MFDPCVATMGWVNIGSGVNAPPVSESPVIETNMTSKPSTTEFLPLKQHMLGSTHDVVDVEHDKIAQFEMSLISPKK